MMSDARRDRTEVVSEVVFLGRLVDRIVAGTIRVPRIQRPFVWNQSHVHALLDSVSRGFPIGSILVWDSEAAIESTERVGPIDVSPAREGLVSYLIDGQQRVSTLVGTLRLTEGADSTVDQVDWRVYCDLQTQQFLRAPRGGLKPQHFPVRSLLNTASFIAACRRIESKVADRTRSQRWLDEADRLASAFRNYQLPLIHIREAGLDSVLTLFARLNCGGRRLAADEMVSALTYRQGEFHLAERLDDFKEQLDRKGFGNLDRVLLLRSVLAALDRDIYAKDWANFMVKPAVRKKLPESFDVATEGISRALSFLRDQGVTTDRLLPYGLQLVMLGEFFRLCPQPCSEVVELLSRWFWVTSFTGWFGGVNDTQATQALSEIRNLARGKSIGFRVVDLDAPAQPFPDRFDGRSARVRAFLLYLASLQPRSLRSEDKLDPGRMLSDLGTRAVGYVSSNSDPLGRLFSNPANRMFLDRDHVGQAFVALAGLSGDMLMKLLPSHGFPIEAIDLLRSGDRAGLIGARLETLIRGERDFMKQRHVILPAEQTAAVIADSDATDDDE